MVDGGPCVDETPDARALEHNSGVDSQPTTSTTTAHNSGNEYNVKTKMSRAVVLSRERRAADQ